MPARVVGAGNMGPPQIARRFFQGLLARRLQSRSGCCARAARLTGAAMTKCNWRNCFAVVATLMPGWPTAAVAQAWSGYVRNSSPPTYQSTSAGATWTVPTVSPSFLPENSATWVGIGGVGVPLIQIGTNIPVPGTQSPLPVNANDVISASLTCTVPCQQGSNQTWTLVINDNTGNSATSWNWTGTIKYPSPGANLNSAEWIVEAPEFTNLLGVSSTATLPKFTPVTFSQLTVNGLNVQQATQIAQPDGAGVTPIVSALAANSLTVCYNQNPCGRQSQSIQVSSTAAWQNYQAVANLVTGETVSITASGQVYIGNVSAGQPNISNNQTPAGDPNTTTAAQTGAAGPFAAPGLVPWSLVGMIGNSGTPFEIGTSASFNVTSTGQYQPGPLYLGINDNYFPDNSGSWAVNLLITSGNATAPSTSIYQLSAATTLPLGNLTGNIPIIISGADTTSIVSLQNNSGYTGAWYFDPVTAQLNTNASLGSGTVNMTGGSVLQANAANLIFSNTLTLANSFGATNTIDTHGNTLTWTGLIADGVPAPGSLTVADTIGGGALVLTNANTYSGGTNLTGGMLVVGNDSALGSGPLSMAAGTALSFLNSGNFTVANNITISGDPFFTPPAGTTQTLSGTISDGSSPGILDMNGAGTLVLSGPNTYSGGTVISGGILQPTNNSSVGSGGVTLDGGVFQSGAPGLAFANGFAINKTGGTIDTQANTLMLSGTISDGNGSGALTKTGSGMLILTGNDTYTGGTTISAGTLLLGIGGTTGSIVGNATDSGNLAFYRSDNITFGGLISGTGSLTQLGPGHADPDGHEQL